MSEIIRLLPDHIANQIAAGEVIQRPASVLKELVENALDAGADHIEVWIKDAGKTLIQVLDNGFGMSEIDARMAFERHATSKLSHADDLFALTTKGFRGEALASIAAIAHVVLQTKQKEKTVGTALTIEGSVVKEQIPTTCKSGTSISVKNLFYNVPARRNFLKSDAVELSHMESEFERIALAHPEVKFQFTHNDQLIHHLESANLRKRIVDLFGRNYNDRLVPIQEKTGIVQLTGFIGKPEFAKKSRGEQFFFVNNRFFKDSYLNHAVNQAYDRLLSPKTYPSYFIFLEIDPAAIDVNVHPTKTEIKFENEREIYAILKSAIKQSLGQFNIAPSLDFEQESSFDLPWEAQQRPIIQPSIQVNPNYNPFQSSGTSQSKGNGHSQAIQNSGFGNEATTPSDWRSFYTLDEQAEEIAEEQQELTFDEAIPTLKNYLFQHPFIICPVKSGLMFVHAPRARERILYDELMQDFMLQPIASQQLLFPIELQLSASLCAFWQENSKLTRRLGFSFEPIAGGLNFTGIPAPLSPDQAQQCMQAIHDQMRDQLPDKGELAHEFILSIARAASMQKIELNAEVATQLIEQLFQCSEHQYGPSGKLLAQTVPIADFLTQF